MADSLKISLSQKIILTGDKPVLMVSDEFLMNYKKVLLRSNMSEKIWEVKLDGDRLSGGWEEFLAVNRFRNGDVLHFRHDGDENFHVTMSLSNINTESEVDDDDGTESDDDESEKAEKDSSSRNSHILKARVTPYSLLNDRLDLSRNFIDLFSEQNTSCEIDLVNKKGRKWTLILSRNNTSGVFYIRRGWSNFCSANKLSQGDFCEFKLTKNGERLVLLLYQHEVNNHQEEEETCPEADKSKKKKKNHLPYLKLKVTPSRFNTGHLYVSSVFMANNGINKSCEITLLNKDGRKWSSCLHITGKLGNEWYYLRKGWKEMCRANGVKVNESFLLELIWENSNPILKFHSKIENNEDKRRGNKRACKKRAFESSIHERTIEKKTRRVEREGHTIRSRVLKSKKQKSCSISDQVANVKKCILDTLNTVGKLRIELKAKENNLEASLLEIESLGERILGISQILNNNLI